MRKSLLIGIATLLAIVVVFLYFFRGGNESEKYQTIEVDRGDIVEKITATGTINPVISVRVGSQVSGRIAAILADFNSEVKEGQVIAQLETDIYQTRVAQADANFRLAEAQEQESRVSLLAYKMTPTICISISRRLILLQQSVLNSMASPFGSTPKGVPTPIGDFDFGRPSVI